MKYPEILEKLKTAIRNRFPEGYGYAVQLSKILEISEEEVAKKLNCEIPFTVEEISKLTVSFNLPVSSIMEGNPDPTKHLFELWIHDFSKHPKKQYTIIQTSEIFNLAAQSRLSLFMATTNTVPDIIFAHFDWAARLQYLKYIYFNRGAKEMPSLSSVIFPEDIRRWQIGYLKAVRNFKRSVYILYHDMMKNLTEHLIFFFRLGFLSEEEAKCVLGDYERILDMLEMICEQGTLLSHKKEIEIFYSDVPVFNDTALIESEFINFGMIYIHCMQPVVTQEQDTFEILKNWSVSLMRSSHIISLSGTSDRTLFFSKQRATLESARGIIGV